jgi:hypothetical protein
MKLLRNFFIVLSMVAMTGIVIQIRKGGLTQADKPKRIYTETIKGNWEPHDRAFQWMMRNEEVVKRLKAIGVNTVSLVAGYQLRNNGSYLILGREGLIQSLTRAKSNGFSVFLATDVVLGDRLPLEGTPGEKLQSYLQSSEQVVLEWAEIAEKYKVEYFGLENELNDRFDHPDFPEAIQAQQGAALRIKLANKWYARMLPKVREIFSGKVVAKFGAMDASLDVPGYDYFAFTLDHYQLDLDHFRESVRRDYERAAKVASSSGVDWFVGETYFFYTEKHLKLDLAEEKRLKDLQDDYFDTALEEFIQFDGAPKPVGFIFGGYLTEGQAIQGRPAEKVIEKYYLRRL